MTRYVWVVQEKGDNETLAIYGRRKRAILYLTGVEVLDEKARNKLIAKKRQDVLRGDDGEPIYEYPTKVLTSHAIHSALRRSSTGTRAQWPLDSAGKAFIQLYRKPVL